MLSIFSHLGSLPLSRLQYSTDIHSHLLPGVDDGLFSPLTAFESIEKMEQRGIRKLYMTPHIMRGVHNNDERVLTERFNELMLLRNNRAPEVEILLGAEYMVDESLVERLRSKQGAEQLLKIEDNRVLIEMSYLLRSPHLDNVVFMLQSSGITPILAHPERYIFFANNLKEIDRLAERGVEFQLNTLSLSGRYGRGSMKIINHILSNGLYSHIGSDLHSDKQIQLLETSFCTKHLAEMGQKEHLWRIL